MMSGVLLFVSFFMLRLLLFSFDVAVTVVLYVVLDQVVLQVVTVIVGLGLGASGHVYQFSEGLVID